MEKEKSVFNACSSSTGGFSLPSTESYVTLPYDSVTNVFGQHTPRYVDVPVAALREAGISYHPDGDVDMLCTVCRIPCSKCRCSRLILRGDFRWAKK